ncbi:MAG: MFS transporter [Actinomycetota bacterium]
MDPPRTDVERARASEAAAGRASGNGRPGLFANRNFRLFFFGQIVSNTGTWLQNVAQGVLVLRLTDSSLMVGVTNAALFVPVLVLALFGGRLADAFDRRRLLIATQVLALSATGVLAVLAGTGHATVTAVIVVAALVGVQYAVSIPAMGALLPALVDRSQLGQAIGMNSVTYNLARVIGPVIATATIAGVGFGWAFGINSVSFVALIVALSLLRLERAPRSEGGGGSIREVMAVAWRNPRLRMMLAGVAAVSMATDPVVTLGPTFAKDVFGRSGDEAGFVVAAFGIGSIVAAVLLSRTFRTPGAARLRVLPWSMALMAAGLAGFAFVPSFWPALAVLLVGGIGYLAASTTWTTALQEEVEDRMRGRVMGLWTLAFLGTRPIASLIDGAVADLAGPKVAVLVILVPLVLVAVLGVPRLRATARATVAPSAPAGGVNPGGSASPRRP